MPAYAALGYPGDPKIHEKCTSAAPCAQGCAKDAPRGAKVRTSAPEVPQRLPNGGKMEARAPLRSHFYRKWPTMLLTHYLLCRTHISHLHFDTFFAPGGTKKRCKIRSLFSTPTKPSKIEPMAPQGRPMGGPWGSQGHHWTPKCLPKASQNHQKMRTCLRGAPQSPTWSPKVAQIHEHR